jgi:hypothetical protein
MQQQHPFLFNNEIEAILSKKNGMVRGWRTMCRREPKAGQTISCDIVGVAVGDVAQVFDPLTGKPVMDVLWPPARDQGRVAGANMAGVQTVYKKEIALNVTRLAGLTTTIIGTIGGSTPDKDTIGIVRGDSETWREIPDAIAAQSNFDVNRIRLMVGEKTLLGAIVMGDQKLSQPIHQLVARQVDITPMRGQLLAPHARVGEVIATFWEQVRR